MTLKQSSVLNIQALKFLLLQVIFEIGVVAYFKFDIFAVQVVLSLFILFSLPAIYLNIEYYYYNKDLVIRFNELGIEKIKHSISSKHNYENCIKVILFKSKNLNKNSFPFTAMDYYWFLRLVFEDGTEININCLLYKNVEEFRKYFPQAKYVNLSGIFASLKLSSKREIYL